MVKQGGLEKRMQEMEYRDAEPHHMMKGFWKHLNCKHTGIFVTSYIQ